jgi:peptidoglycan/xylan/chitin deacetylase (PgdA/CDA1 family)
MEIVRIALEPALKLTFGPEIEWTLRTLLVNIGWKWQEVEIHDACDLAFTDHVDEVPYAKVVICANPRYWTDPSLRRIKAVNRENGIEHLVFQEEKNEALAPELRRDRLIIHRDMLFDIFWLLTGQEEKYFPKDKHGFMDLTGNPYLTEKIMQEATASQMMLWLSKLLIEQGFPQPMPQWPGEKNAVVCLGHDVDYPEVVPWLQPLRVLLSRGFQGVKPAIGILQGRNHHWHFRSWMEIAKSFGMKSTFFFVPRQGSLLQYLLGLPDPFYDVDTEKFRALLQEIKAENFEIGLHSSYLAYQSVEKFKAEKSKLEKASGGPITGNHHHYWHLNPFDVEETLWMHEQVGFLYDASLVHDRYIGWRRATSLPFYPFRQSLRRELRTLQVQNTWMDDQLFGNKKYNPGDRQAILRGLAELAAKQGGCIVITMHEYIFDDMLYPDWVNTFKEFMFYLKGRGDFWIASPGEIADHWQKRYQSLCQESLGLDQGR